MTPRCLSLHDAYQLGSGWMILRCSLERNHSGICEPRGYSRVSKEGYEKLQRERDKAGVA